MKRIIFIFLINSYLFTSIFCHNRTEHPTIDTSNIYSGIDSLTCNWYKAHPYQNLSLLTDDIQDTNDVDFPDSAFIYRISSLPNIIPLSYNKIVKNFIEVYTKKKRDETRVMLGLTEYYFPIIEEILEEYKLPNELKYMPVIESALNPNAVSRAGATGLWQFMFGTAKMYKLQINSLIDERRDPIKSSHAAAKYLLDLYEIYNDWILVIAAYNCGPGNVNKAIRRSGSKRDYWEIYYHLPRETRGYIPAFIAVNYVFNFYHLHNLKPVPIEFTIPTDTLVITQELHLKQVSEVLGISHSELRDLNPQYRWDILPKNPAGNVLKLPLQYINSFIVLEDSIYNYKDSVYFNPEAISSQPAHYSKYTPVTPKGKTKIYYTVKPGDNLGYIAEWYDIYISDLRYWNNISRNLIRSGQKLIIFVPNNKVEYYKKINSMTFEEKQKMAGIALSNPVNQSSLPENYELIYYKVKSGDTLWKIAQKYPGVSEFDILKLNNIENANKLFVGQTLKIKRPVY